MQGHNGERDIQLNFWDRELRRKFSFREGGIYTVIGVERVRAHPLYRYNVMPYTTIKEENPFLRDIPKLSPEITSESRRETVFCTSIGNLREGQYCNILGRYLNEKPVTQGDGYGFATRRGKRIYFEVRPGEISYICLWCERADDCNFQPGQFIIWRYLQKAANDRFELKMDYCSSYLLLSDDDIAKLPQARVFENYTPAQESETRYVTIQALKDEILQPKMSGLFTVELVNVGNSMFYLGCPIKTGDLECRKKTEKARLLNQDGWKCAKGHWTTQQPIQFFRARIKVHDGTGIDRVAVFLCDKAKQLFGMEADIIYQLEEESRREKLQEKLQDKVFYLTLHLSHSKDYPGEWQAYDVLPVE